MCFGVYFTTSEINKKGGGENTVHQPVMEVNVKKKTKLMIQSQHVVAQRQPEYDEKSELAGIDCNMGFAQITWEHTHCLNLPTLNLASVLFLFELSDIIHRMKRFCRS